MRRFSGTPPSLHFEQVSHHEEQLFARRGRTRLPDQVAHRAGVDLRGNDGGIGRQVDLYWAGQRVPPWPRGEYHHHTSDDRLEDKDKGRGSSYMAGYPTMDGGMPRHRWRDTSPHMAGYAAIDGGLLRHVWRGLITGRGQMRGRRNFRTAIALVGRFFVPGRTGVDEARRPSTSASPRSMSSGVSES